MRSGSERTPLWFWIGAVAMYSAILIAAGFIVFGNGLIGVGCLVLAIVIYLLILLAGRRMRRQQAGRQSQ